MIIGALTFGRDELGYGLEVVKKEVEKTGHLCYTVTPKTACCCDVILFSIFWWEHLFVLADWLRKAGINKEQKNRPRLIAGGFNTFNPLPILAYVDAVVVGDGEGVIAQAITGNYDHESILTDGKTSVLWRTVPELNPICLETNNIARIELARGCKFKCRFCAVTYLKKYREASIADIEQCLRQTKLSRVSLFAPEPTLHSQDDEVTAICRRLKKTRLDSDVRLDRLDYRVDSVPRVGIEGLSERLRKSVNKGYSNAQIVEAVKNAIKAGRKGIFMYLILDLPAEKQEDWEEFGELLNEIGTLKGAEKFLLKPSPSVFLPTPHTPMAGEPINWDRDYGAIWSGFFGRGEARKWRVLMAERNRVFSPQMRLLSMMSTRCGLEFKELEKALTKAKYIAVSGGRPVIRDKKGVVRVLQRDNIIQHLCGARNSGAWDIVKLTTTKKV